MSEYDFDVLYLGSGHGAFDGAGPLAASGKKVGVIESDMIGGTCPNYGCNAKITLDGHTCRVATYGRTHARHRVRQHHDQLVGASGT